MTEEKRRMPGTESQAQSGVQSIERALDIIEAVAAEESGLNLTEISKRTQLHKSTAYRIIETLTGRGYLAKTQEGNYRIGLKLIEAVSYYINSLELQTEARPYVAKLITSGRIGWRVCRVCRKNGCIFFCTDVFTDWSSNACILFLAWKVPFIRLFKARTFRRYERLQFHSFYSKHNSEHG